MPDAAELDRLAGLVERVTFHNEQNGFCVLRLKVKGERELITACWKSIRSTVSSSATRTIPSNAIFWWPTNVR